MKNGIYSTAGGMLTSAERLNVISNNLSNFSTHGFKADIPFEQTLRFLAEGPFPGKDQPVLGGTELNMQQGLIKTTGRKLDMAFEGEGFFTVQGPDNRQYFTRNGAFNLNSKRELVTSDGFNLLDRFDKKITIAAQNEFYFTPKGDIIVDGNYYTSLKIISQPDKNDIQKVGDTFFKFKDDTRRPQLSTDASLYVGALEKSNVNLLKGIAQLMRTQRAFEMQKTAADTMFKVVRKVITDIPKPV
jgi:flagellar basal body rod protein FlgG